MTSGQSSCQKMYLAGGGSSSASKTNGQSSRSHTQQEAKIYQELYDEVRKAPPLGTLSLKVKCGLESLCSDIATRKALVSRIDKDSGCSPLFIACKKGNVEIVEYLLDKCAADVEQKGLYEVPDDQSVHHVSPLWCAR